MCGSRETYPPSAPLFTSDEALWPRTVAGFNSLSGDPDANPLYSTYNRVFVPYCTQDLMLLDTEASDGGLQFRGGRTSSECFSRKMRTRSPGKGSPRVRKGLCLF